jgi:plastocyanin
MQRLRLVVGLISILMFAPRAMADDYLVVVGNIFFDPKELGVFVGDSVHWRNYEGVHSTTADDMTWDSGVAAAPWAFAFNFTDPGDYYYYCTVHGAPGGVGQAGVIHVFPMEGP